MTWEDIGIGSQNLFAGLYYNPSSEALVAQTYRVMGDTRVMSLWLRRPADQRYRPLSEPSDVHSFESVAVSPSAPYLYSCVDLDDRGAMNWDSFRVYDLRDVSVEYTSTKIEYEAPYKCGWMSSVVGCTDDCHTVVCVIALQRLSGLVEYWLSEYTWPEGTYSQITELKEVFL